MGCLPDDDAGVVAVQTSLPAVTSAVAETLLHGYTAAGKVRLLTALLEVGACDVNAQRAKDGCTALHIAMFRGQEGSAATLRMHGADSTIRNKWGETPVEAAGAAAPSAA